MRRALVVVAATAAVWLAAPAVALAGPCGLPDTAPLWIDFADGTAPAPVRAELAHPGTIVATSGTSIPAAFRRGGAQTIYWQMHFEADVGTPGAPAPSGSIGSRADTLFNLAASQSGCATPVIALNEMQGVTIPPPLNANSTQYRLNVLAFVQELVTRGATPYLLLAASPNTTGDEAGFWKELSSYAYIVREVYESAPKIIGQGVDLGSRTMRVDLRTAVLKLGMVGIPPSRIGLMLGFHSNGTTGRVGLQPLSSWLEYVKLATLAADQVAGELGVESLWAWGWGTLSAAGADPDKATAACVELWTRDQTLCDAPSVAQFDTSLTDGQLSTLPDYAQCVVGGRVLPTSQLDQAWQLLGTRAAAYTALLERLAATALVPVDRADEQTAQKALFPQLGRFLAAARSSGVTPGFARGVIVDDLRYSQVDVPTLIAEEQSELSTTICRGDVLPTPGDVRLSSKLPFLAPLSAPK